MIGNNSCGATAQRTGKVVDNVVRLEVLLYDGTRMWVGETPDDEFERIVAAGGRPAEIYRALARAARRVRRRDPRALSRHPAARFGLQPRFAAAGKGFPCRAGAGRLREHARHCAARRVEARAACACPHARRHRFRDIAAAADAVPTILPSSPIALEAIDANLVDFQRKKHLHPAALDLLPEGDGFLIVQMGGERR